MATKASEWKRVETGVDLKVPSGHVARVKAVGIEVLMRRGMIPNALLPIIQKHLKKGDKVNSSQVMEEITETPELITNLLRLMDDVVVYCVIEPRVLPVPPQENPSDALTHDPDFERDAEALYVDEVDEEDKAFILQFVIGGTQDIEEFRKDSSELLESVPDGKNVAVSAK